mmetsp:Transcript_3949/g.5347  ORF Transcript_3949/g.5347 Transcript_3949/m.5347 type:complete len:82 (+) Transcript_3949:996-1241(+)
MTICGKLNEVWSVFITLDSVTEDDNFVENHLCLFGRYFLTSAIPVCLPTFKLASLTTQNEAGGANTDANKPIEISMIVEGT